MIDVPRVTVLANGRVSVTLADGRRGCSKCCLRPRAAGQRWCRVCLTENARNRRAGKIEVLLSPEEWAAVKALRAAARG